MRHKDERAKRIGELLTDKVKFTRYYHVWENLGIYFFEDMTYWYKDCVFNTPKDEYFFNKGRDEWMIGTISMQIENTLYHVKSPISASKLIPVMRSYHKEKQNGNVRVFRLD